MSAEDAADGSDTTQTTLDDFTDVYPTTDADTRTTPPEPTDEPDSETREARETAPHLPPADADETYRDESWLRTRYVEWGWSTTAIADECGASVSTICTWLPRNGIRIRQPPGRHPTDADDDTEPYRDEAYLRKQYVERGRSAADIANECGVSASTVLDWLRRHLIERRGVGFDGDGATGLYTRLLHHDRYPWNRARRAARDAAADACEVCGAIVDDFDDREHALPVHHILPVVCGGPNSLRNLMVVCPAHHNAAEEISQSVFTPLVEYAEPGDLDASDGS